jgi:hypothetical protein
MSTYLEIIKILSPIIGVILGYVIGKQNKIDEIKIKQAFPKAEEISRLIQEIYHEDISFITIWEKNFGHLDNFQKGVNYFQENAIFDQDRARVIELAKKRQQLHDSIISSRVYLNSKVLNLIEAYLQLDEFSFTDDGMGGVLVTTYWADFFANILDDGKKEKRKKIYQKIKRMMNSLCRS